MSRARNIKPGFFENERLAECQPLARLLFAGLWCESDREGRLEDRPKRIKAKCLPYDETECDDLLNELASHGFITRYVVDGNAYIAVNEFAKHQNPHQREVPSTIPSPSVAKHNLGDAQAQPRIDLAEDCTGSARLIPDSPSMIPDSRESTPHAPSSPDLPASDPTGTEAGRACLLMRQAGCARVNSSHPNLLAALDEGVTAQALRDTYLENPTATNPFAWAIATARSRHAEGASPTPQARAGPAHPQPNAPGKVMAGILRLEAMKNELAETRIDDRISNPHDARLGSSAGR